MRARKEQEQAQKVKDDAAKAAAKKEEQEKQKAKDDGTVNVKRTDTKKERQNKANQQHIEDLTRNKEASTGMLIKYVMDCIEKEERMTTGATGKRRLLSFKEKNKLIKDFLNIRAHPEQNRLFQAKQAKILDIRQQQEREQHMNERLRKLQSEL